MTHISPSVKDKIKNVLQLPTQRIEEFLSVCVIIIHGKNELIEADPHTSQHLGYIINGAARTYYLNEKGEEISYLLQVNDDVIGDYESYITGKKSEAKIETLVQTEVLYFENKSIEQLIQKDLFWSGFAKRLSDLAFLSAKQRLDELFFYTPEQRYLNLIAKSPEILNKIPQKYISSYLSITPQSLSRIRKRIF